MSFEFEPEDEVQEAAPPPSIDVDSLLDLRLRVWAELGRAHMPAARIVAMPPGSIIDLDRAPDDPAEIFVNGRRLGTGKLLLVDGEWAIRLETIDEASDDVEVAGDCSAGVAAGHASANDAWQAGGVVSGEGSAGVAAGHASANDAWQAGGVVSGEGSAGVAAGHASANDAWPTGGVVSGEGSAGDRGPSADSLTRAAAPDDIEMFDAGSAGAATADHLGVPHVEQTSSDGSAGAPAADHADVSGIEQTSSDGSAG